jgi:hypothetical protein
LPLLWRAPAARAAAAGCGASLRCVRAAGRAMRCGADAWHARGAPVACHLDVAHAATCKIAAYRLKAMQASNRDTSRLYVTPHDGANPRQVRGNLIE